MYLFIIFFSWHGIKIIKRDNFSKDFNMHIDWAAMVHGRCASTIFSHPSIFRMKCNLAGLIFKHFSALCQPVVPVCCRWHKKLRWFFLLRSDLLEKSLWLHWIWACMVLKVLSTLSLSPSYCISFVMAQTYLWAAVKCTGLYADNTVNSGALQPAPYGGEPSDTYSNLLLPCSAIINHMQ